VTERGRIAAEHRDKRAGVIEQRPQKPISKTKRDRPWVVMYQWKTRQPHVFGRYATREIAEKVISLKAGQWGAKLTLVEPEDGAKGKT
jgi:hypothetical protein